MRGELAERDPARADVWTVRRAAEPDIGFLAQVMYESMLPGVGRGIFDVALEPVGADPIRFHEALLRTGANNWGQLDSFLVIEGPEGRPGAAMGCFLSSIPDRRPLTSEGFKRVAEHLAWPEPARREFWRRYTRFFGVFGDAAQLAQPADYVLEFAWVRPDLQRRGLYGRLTEAHARQARALGCRTLGGTAVFGNDKVIGALHKAGFREHSRFGPEYYRGEFPGMIRLVRNL